MPTEADLSQQLDIPCITGHTLVDAAVGLAQANALTPVQWGRRCCKLWNQVDADEKFTLVGEGGLRRTYRQGKDNSVFKIPYAEHWMLAEDEIDHDFLSDVLLANIIEQAHWMHQDFFGAPVLPCKVVWTDKAVPLLVMEYADTSAVLENKPAWGQTIDSGQIAWSKMTNRWAAYDACSLPTQVDDVLQENQVSETSQPSVFSLIPKSQVPLLAMTRELQAL